MRNTFIIAKRELMSYFATPVAYVFIVIFLAFTGSLAFYVAVFLIVAGPIWCRSFSTTPGCISC